MLTALILLALFETACSSVRYECPPLASYSQSFQSGAAEELEALPPGSRVGTLVTDYGKMRKACRAMEAAKS
ncbi:hypothetical protein EVC11_036 [Rhizobium phage RHph_I20]|uniref:Uncharacterized protein n=1 Tax=Rhizobium phage RHph_I20 TaxID=2509730 RepID=A0A7S5V0P9_9CAUD|nr:hypothetical protein EVC11_036 [Rhizobium phage RHph_I20]